MTDPEPDDGDDGGDDEPEPTSLSGMTKAQLLDYADSHGIQGVSGLSKKKLIETLGEAADA